ncbi:Transcriptional regulator, TetR family protein [Minicystis rosea]|nr:Transcriptional regulator, TetR family protein [Minicystis rosea]
MDEHREPLWTRLSGLLRRVPRQARARAVVEAILEAAEESFEVVEHGPLLPIFERAGVAAGSFYEYFASREALLAAVVERVTDRNFETFLAEIDAATATEASFEQAVRRGADIIVRHYLRHPAQLRTVIHVADRLGLLAHIGRTRDRFADALSARVSRFTPHMTPSARADMMRAAADVLTGVVVVSLFRVPHPPLEEISRTACDAAWGVIRVHVDGARPPDA